MTAALRIQLADANRILFDQGVLDAFGHVSVRSAERPDRFLLARNMAPALVTPEDSPLAIWKTTWAMPGIPPPPWSSIQAEHAAIAAEASTTIEEEAVEVDAVVERGFDLYLGQKSAMEHSGDPIQDIRAERKSVV